MAILRSDSRCYFNNKLITKAYLGTTQIIPSYIPGPTVSNTFIGGIAKLGGTGDNAPILTAAELATTLGISESIIQGFKVVGEDVECVILENFSLPSVCFQNNENIIFFNSHNVTSIGANAFRSCASLTSVDFPLVTSVGGGSFWDCTSLVAINILLCKALGLNLLNNYVFRDISLNSTINSNIYLKTVKSGEPDDDLLYAYNSRNATINFYDDEGNFVETYNP